ncbi:putative disease resistance protein RGA1 [Rhododendron vialii]|uniref:putative disease resistance protein RGA1 n=1 Tax=Rhododendron vialii TaxID=182163 RepID=UPI00265E69D9|nr:putative disease resistance protein RGA1 [Rhododendron vialii]
MKQCPPELVDIGKQIAEKCKGLPLAIVTIAGILATEDKTLDVWEEVAKNFSMTIAKKQEGCMEILELSYNHLPLHLKGCFLYIGAHPEDYEIPIRELIWLWIVEGFIQQSEGGKSLEDVAEDYLIGLIDRSLVMGVAFHPATSPGMIEIGDLVHLRYLATRLYSWWGEALECCFHYLSNVETLNLQASSNEGTIPLPRNIVKMVELRHLYNKGNLLDSLQTLHGMCTCEHCLRFLKRTPNLRNLKLIDGLHFEGDDVLTLPGLEFLKCLETLTVITSSKRLRVTSTGLKFPPTLMRLNLWRTHLKWEELSIILQTLPRLEVLKLLEGACVGPVWNTSELEGWLIISTQVLEVISSGYQGVECF